MSTVEVIKIFYYEDCIYELANILKLPPVEPKDIDIESLLTIKK